jgi:plastocyanin
MARSMGRPHAKLAVALLAGLAALPGCGDDAARAKRGTLALELVDFRIDPQEVRARRGEATVSVVNRGRLPHNLKVMAGERTQIGFTTLLSGARASKVRTLRKGTYKLVCTVGNHEELGMYGTLTVR